MNKKLFLILTILFSFNCLAKEEGLFNKLLAPGPLLKGHRDLERVGCLNCHAMGEGVPDYKCMKCHKDIKQFVKLKKGFHGNQKKACIKCHKDHEGELYDSTKFKHKSFNHQRTQFSLHGEHKKLKCSKCHTKKRGSKVVRSDGIKFLGATATCKSCHNKNDVHFYPTNETKYKKMDCNQCHNEKKWKEDVNFNHLKESKFDLVGKHKKLKCAQCHIVNKSKKLSKYHWRNLKKNQCLSCHKDIHKNNLSAKFQGGKCIQCHNQNSWKLIKSKNHQNFNHNITNFKLKGKHAKITCIKCHKQSKEILKNKTRELFKWNNLKTSCVSCHKDIHKYNQFKSKKYPNPKNCKSCHNTLNWKKTTFNHNTQTRYPITGAHKILQCSNCHLQKINLLRKGGKFSTKNKFVNLKKSIYHWNQLNSKTCTTCHLNPHLKSFSKKVLKQRCTVCHITKDWKIIRSVKNQKFDHNATRFKLTGEHLNLKCQKCHLKKNKKIFKFNSVKKNFCNDCHNNIHIKQFSTKMNQQSCSTCHNSSSFKNARKFNHNLTNYKLKGKHKKLQCFECHKKTRNKFKKLDVLNHQFLFPKLKSKRCTQCHNDIHKKQLGNSCNKCHSEKGWNNNRFKHNKMSSFKLKGAHKKTKCIKCHKMNKKVTTKFKKRLIPFIRFKPINQACTNCHKDKHKGEFGSTCLSCHNFKTWKGAKNFHTIEYKLKGIHNRLQCIECHKNKPLNGLSNQCITCHKKDDSHQGQLPNCTKCHTQAMWPAVTFKHTQTQFPLRGVHKTLSCNRCHGRGYYTNVATSCSDCHLARASEAKVIKHVMPNFSDCSGCHSQFTFQKQ